ncbi:MAG: hypothetical protein WCB46_06380 [Methanoregula sp.]
MQEHGQIIPSGHDRGVDTGMTEPLKGKAAKVPGGAHVAAHAIPVDVSILVGNIVVDTEADVQNVSCEIRRRYPDCFPAPAGGRMHGLA